MGLLTLRILEFGHPNNPCNSENPIAFTKTYCLVWTHSRFHHRTILFWEHYSNRTKDMYRYQAKILRYAYYFCHSTTSVKALTGSDNFMKDGTPQHISRSIQQLLRYHLQKKRSSVAFFLLHVCLALRISTHVTFFCGIIWSRKSILMGFLSWRP